jgi:hypothetical protein
LVGNFKNPNANNHILPQNLSIQAVLTWED